MANVKKISSTTSKYSKAKFKQKASGDFEDDVNDTSDLTEGQGAEEFASEEGFDEEGSGEDAFDETGADDVTLQSPSGHVRSRGLFQNVWWKKGALKGFIAWAIIVIIFYVFDFLKMVEVISWQRWGFFLILLLILGIAYEKFFSGKIQI
ncbi:MAG: hypothetical protein WC915_00555 [archaeon]|jgi:hypothetical protein